ncbi:MAG: 50S ribosomal protein L9 [Rickettsiales bacterium]
MQVILLEKIKNLGDIGSVVYVKNGYARNFLLPREKCIAANKNSIAQFEARRQEVERQNEEYCAIAEKDAKKISGSFYSVLHQASDDGKLFGSVSGKQVAVLANVDKHAVIIHSPIKALGVHKVTIRLHAEIEAEIFVVVARTEDEAEKLKTQFIASTQSAEKNPEGEAISAA